MCRNGTTSSSKAVQDSLDLAGGVPDFEQHFGPSPRETGPVNSDYSYPLTAALTQLDFDRADEDTPFDAQGVTPLGLHGI